MEKINVLLVDDKPQVILDLGKKLEKMGFIVTTVVDSADQALLEIAGKSPGDRPHVVLIAVETGDAAGVDCIESARRIRQLVDVPVIYITPAFYEENVKQAANLSLPSSPAEIGELPPQEISASPGSNEGIMFSPRTIIEKIRRTEPFAHIIKPGDEWELRYILENAIYRHRLEKRLNARLRCERGIADTVLSLLVYIEPREALQNCARHLQRASESSRVYIFENFVVPHRGLCMRRLCEACGSGVEPQIDNPFLQQLPYSQASPLLLQKLQNGETYQGMIEELPEADRMIFEPQGILSIVIFPIQVEGTSWGFIGFDDVRKRRRWSEDDLRLLRVAADVVGEYLSRKKLEERIHKVSQEWYATFDAINDAICLVDMEGNVLRCNSAMANLIGQTFTQIIGQNICTLIDKNREHPGKCPFRIVKKSHQRETRVVPAFNRTFKISVDPFFDSEGNLTGAVHIMSEVNYSPAGSP